MGQPCVTRCGAAGNRQTRPMAGTGTPARAPGLGARVSALVGRWLPGGGSNGRRAPTVVPMLEPLVELRTGAPTGRPGPTGTPGLPGAPGIVVGATAGWPGPAAGAREPTSGSRSGPEPPRARQDPVRRPRPVDRRGTSRAGSTRGMGLAVTGSMTMTSVVVADHEGAPVAASRAQVVDRMALRTHPLGDGRRARPRPAVRCGWCRQAVQDVQDRRRGEQRDGERR